MYFEEILPALRQGKRFRRRYWAEMGGAIGDWLELVSGARTGTHALGEVLMIWKEQESAFLTWGGVFKDILKDDWEEL